MSRFMRFVAVVSVVFGFAGLSSVFAQGNSWKVFLAAAYVSPLDSNDVDLGTITDSVEASDELGWDVGGEFRSKWFGIELDYLGVSHSVDTDTLSDIGDVDLALITGTFNIHLVHTKIIDFYFGPSVSWADWGDVSFDIPGQGSFDASTDSETAFGLSVGADFALIKTIAIVTGLRYIDLDLTAEDETLSVNPLIARAGVAFRF